MSLARLHGERCTPDLFAGTKKKSTVLPTKYSAFLVEITGPILITVTLLQSMHGAPLGELSPHSFGNNKKGTTQCVMPF